MEDGERALRRPHSAQLKAQVLAECSQQGMSVAKVALAHGLNANLVHNWRRAADAATAQPSALVGATAVNIHWPEQGGSDCAAWLREWLR